MKKILLISPFPPSQNPRLVKEYTALKNAGYEVKVIYAERDKWASLQNADLGPDFILVGGKLGSFFHLFTRLIHKISKHTLPDAYSYHRASMLLLAKAIQIKADLYIGHDLTSLPIVVKAAQKNKAKSGFDAEDFHRNEVSDDKNSFFYRAAVRLENKYIPKINYLTTASPLISARYNMLYPGSKAQTIHNVFSAKYIAKPNPLQQGKPIKLFWFSQTIGKDRGIEMVLEAIGLLKSKMVRLTLLGSITPSTKVYFEQVAKDNGLLEEQLIFLSPVAPEEVFKIANQHDIGLALELDTPYNRDICLTNKIFTYLISGLTIIATETRAQKLFLESYPSIGHCFPIGHESNLAAIIDHYIKNPFELVESKLQSNKQAISTLNWENESLKFLEIINNTLKDE